jgi:hypothetical protein
VPEQVQLEDAVEPSKRGQSEIGERAVDQQPRPLVVSGLQQGEVVQQGDADIRDEPPGAEPAELRLVLERLDRAVACRRAHQVDFLQPVAEPQIRGAAVGDAGLPRHLELPQVRQMAQDLQAAVGLLAARILAQVEVLELRHPREMQQTVVRELARPSQVEARHEVQPGDASQRFVRHQAIGVERGNPPFPHDADQLVPIGGRHPTARPDAVVFGIERVRRTLRRRAGREGLYQLLPAAEAGVLSEEDPRFFDGEVVLRDPEGSLAVCIVAPPDFRLEIREGEGPTVVTVQPFERRGIAVIGADEVSRGLLVRLPCSRFRHTQRPSVALGSRSSPALLGGELR